MGRNRTRAVSGDAAAIQRVGGFTLVEVLCATMVGGTLVALGGFVALQSVSTSRTVEKELGERWGEAHVQEQFRHDVRSSLIMLKGSESTPEVPVPDGQLLEITGLAAIPDLRSPFAQRLPSRIRYRVEKSTQNATLSCLVRQVEPLVDSDRPRVVREILVDGLLTATVSQFTNGAWVERGGRSNPGQAMPDGYRLTLQWGRRERPATVCTALVPRNADTNDRKRK